MASMRKIAPLFVLGLALSALGLGACGGDDSGGVSSQETYDGPVKVGIILPMTGDQNTYGKESWNGIQMAWDEIKDGEDAPQLELILRDEKSLKQDAGNRAKELIETEQVHVLIGSVASGHTIQIFQEATESGVPCISPASTKDGITTSKYTSRICFSDSFQGAVLANFALDQGWDKVALVVDKGQPYAMGLAENFQLVFDEREGTTTTDYYTKEDTDFSNVIQSVVEHDPDAIFIAGYYPQAGPMIKQAKGQWTGKPILGGDGLDSPDLVPLVGDTNAEIYMSSHFAADMPVERVQQWAERYKQRFGESPGAMAGLGYDVLLVLVDAIGRCKNPANPDQLAAAIAATKNLEGITGTISLDNAQRTPVKDAVIVKVDGALKFHALIKATP